FAYLPELSEAKFRIARVIGRSMVRERRSVPGKLERRGTVAAARQAHVQRVERLVAGVLKPVLGADLQEWLRLRRKADVDFLLPSDIARTERRGATREQASRKKTQPSNGDETNWLWPDARHKFIVTAHYRRAKQRQAGPRLQLATAAVNTHKAGAGMGASLFSCGSFGIGLSVSHATLDA